MKYTVYVIGASKALYEGNNLHVVQNMWARWQCKLSNCDVVAIDNMTGEVVAMRGYMGKA